MSTPAQQAANIANAQLSTGAITEAGKAASARNATTHGLFTRNDFIRPGETETYAHAKADLNNALAPANPLEQSLADEIHRAIWRLRRCGEVEGSLIDTLSNTPYAIPDAIENDATAKLQHSVDRARAQSHRLLHKCINQLRSLQTERRFRNEALKPGVDLTTFGLCDYRLVQKGLADEVAARLRQRGLDEAEQFDSVCNIVQEKAEALLAKQSAAPPPAPAPRLASICKIAVTPPQTPRNAPCPCKSGEKYKRCCGKNAPPFLHAA